MERSQMLEPRSPLDPGVVIASWGFIDCATDIGSPLNKVHMDVTTV